MMDTFSPGWVCALLLFWWELNCELRSITIHAPDQLDGLNGKISSTDGELGFSEGFVPATCTVPHCKAVPWPISQLCHLCRGSQSHPPICTLHVWHRWAQRVTGQGSLRTPHTPHCGECATGDSCTALSSWVRAARLLIVFHGTVQPCLIFLPSLLHKFSWPGKFLRGQ